jgi:hypothetical protein
MLTVTFAECHIKAPYAECRYAECRYAECRGAPSSSIINEKVKQNIQGNMSNLV